MFNSDRELNLSLRKGTSFEIATQVLPKLDQLLSRASPGPRATRDAPDATEPASSSDSKIQAQEDPDGDNRSQTSGETTEERADAAVR